MLPRGRLQTGKHDFRGMELPDVILVVARAPENVHCAGIARMLLRLAAEARERLVRVLGGHHTSTHMRFFAFPLTSKPLRPFSPQSMKM